MDNALRGELYIEIPAKIADLEEAGLRYQHVGRLQVPMDDVLLMHVVEAKYDLANDLGCVAFIQIKFCD